MTLQVTACFRYHFFFSFSPFSSSLLFLKLVSFFSYRNELIFFFWLFCFFFFQSSLPGLYILDSMWGGVTLLVCVE